MEVKSGRWCVPAGEAGEVPAAVHLEQLAPMLVEHFGDAWWRCGSVSVRVVSPTRPGEPVQAHLEPLANGCRVWMNAEGEELILQGVAGLGENAPSALREILDPVASTGEVRASSDAGSRTLCIPSSEVSARLAGVTEPLRGYRDPGAYQAPVVPAGSLAAAVQSALPLDPATDGEQVEGAFELHYLAGPVLCDQSYRLSGDVLATAEDERGVDRWYRYHLHQHQGAPAARLIRMVRFGYRGKPLSHAAPR